MPPTPHAGSGATLAQAGPRSQHPLALIRSEVE